MSAIDTDRTVAFLRCPDAFGGGTRAVTAVETHLSWVFLTDEFAYKLKKPIQFDSLDFRTPETRRRNCHEEVHLNRRLAPAVYLGVVTVTRAPDGSLALDGQGEMIDWLVHMRRLPADRMLDAILVTGRAREEEAAIRRAARHLAAFFGGLEPEPIAAGALSSTLERGIRRDLAELATPRYRLPVDHVERLARAQLAFLADHHALFEQRVGAGRIVEGHGDLRPEHIAVDVEPAIIDCLEFDKALRVVDPADELAFLSLECERLGEPRVGQWFLDAYSEASGDRPPPSLLHFYRRYRALRRATLAIWHLDDPAVPDPERFATRARAYLNLVV